MNGLVGMLGSGMPETYELKVLLQYIQDVSLKYQRAISVPEELAWLVDQLSMALDILDLALGKDVDISNEFSVPHSLFNYWDAVASAREVYNTRSTAFSGRVQEYSYMTVYHHVTRWLAELDKGIQRANLIGTSNSNLDDNNLGIPATYFSFNVTKWVLNGGKDSDGQYLVNATEMAVNKFPLFLEGPVRSMKTYNQHDAKQIYDRVKESGLYDKELGMYTLSARYANVHYLFKLSLSLRTSF